METSTSHLAVAVRIPMNLATYQGQCSCGWASYLTEVEDEATSEALTHLAASTRDESWEGFRGGQLVAVFPDRSRADRALELRRVELVGPANQARRGAYA